MKQVIDPDFGTDGELFKVPRSAAIEVVGRTDAQMAIKFHKYEGCLGLPGPYDL